MIRPDCIFLSMPTSTITIRSARRWTLDRIALASGCVLSQLQPEPAGGQILSTVAPRDHATGDSEGDRDDRVASGRPAAVGHPSPGGARGWRSDAALEGS